MRHRIEFLNPVFNSGTNVTIRKGPKWSLEAKVGDEVLLVETGVIPYIGEEVIGVITDIKLKSFSDITIGELEKEHDPSCRQIYGLIKAMRAAYGDISMDNYVTILQFEVI